MPVNDKNWRVEGGGGEERMGSSGPPAEVIAVNGLAWNLGTARPIKSHQLVHKATIVEGPRHLETAVDRRFLSWSRRKRFTIHHHRNQHRNRWSLGMTKCPRVQEHSEGVGG